MSRIPQLHITGLTLKPLMLEPHKKHYTLATNLYTTNFVLLLYLPQRIFIFSLNPPTIYMYMEVCPLLAFLITRAPVSEFNVYLRSQLSALGQKKITDKKTVI